MSVGEFFKILGGFVGGLGVFMLGMKFMSEGLQAVAGDRLRRMISTVTDNRFLGVLTGLTVTLIVQSSSVTTVMVVGLVNSGFMTLVQALGVIFGANIGTTITGWILVLRLGEAGLPILGVAAFFFLFAKSERLRYIGMTLMGVGMIFFGLELMKDGVHPLRDFEGIRVWFHAFDATTLFGVIKAPMVGCIMTILLQSSSATLAITMSLAASGIIEFRTAAALVLGENVGTTITAYLASLGATTTAKRAAWGHIIFNVIGTIWFISVFPLGVRLVELVMRHDPNTMTVVEGVEIFPYIFPAIAMVHTGFNLANALLFLPFVGLMARAIERLLPDKGEKDEVRRLTFLDARTVDSPSLGIIQSRKQIQVMAEATEKVFGYLETVIEHPEGVPELEEKIFRREEILDQMQKEVVVFLGRLLTGEVPHDVTEEARGQIRMADEYETLSDYQTSVLKGLVKLRKNQLKISEEGMEDLRRFHAAVTAYVAMINQGLRTGNRGILTRARADGDYITRLMKEIRKRHLQRLSDGGLPPLKSLIYMDILNHYRRMKDHAFNVAEVLAGEK